MDFTYCPFNITLDENFLDKIYNEVLTITKNHWHYNEFRGCFMLPVYNGGGQLGTGRIGQHNLNFGYTEPVQEKCATLISLIEDAIWPWMEPRGRVTILRTPAGVALKPHLDSLENEIGTLQHKWRLVLHGEIDKLYFIDANYNSMYVPDTNRCYVLDGSHPHALKAGETEKMTLCIGSPWHGEPNKKYHTLLDYPNSLLVTRPNELKEAWTDPFWKASAYD